MFDWKEILDGLLLEKIDRMNLRVVRSEQPKKARTLRLEILFKDSDSKMVYEKDLGINFRRRPKRMKATKNM